MIIITADSHHSNIPWQLAAERIGGNQNSSIDGRGALRIDTGQNAG